MALNFPSSPTNGQTYTDGNSVVWLYDGTKWDVVTSNTKKFFSGAKQLLTTSYSLTSTSSAITFTTQPYDTDNYYAGGNATRLTVSRNGYYRINVLVLAGVQGSGTSYDISVVKNGSTQLSQSFIGPNQSAAYDEIVQLDIGDYIELKGSESGSVGTLLSGTMLELTRLGLTLGTGITSYEAFSGVRTVVSGDVSMTTTPTAITWTSASFNTNANVLGANYWTAGTPTRLTVGISGYFRIKSFIATGTAGTTDSYTITLKKNGSTTLATINMSANESAEFDETYNLAANDYIEMLVSNAGATGTILQSVYLEVVRLGVQ